MSNKRFGKVKAMWPKGAPQKPVQQPLTAAQKWDRFVKKTYRVFEFIIYWVFNIDMILLLYFLLFVW